MLERSSNAPPRRGLYLEHVAPEPAADTSTHSQPLSNDASTGAMRRRSSSGSRIPIPARMAQQRRRSSKSIEMDDGGNMHTVEHETYASAMASRFLRLHTESERRGNAKARVRSSDADGSLPKTKTLV